VRPFSDQLWLGRLTPVLPDAEKHETDNSGQDQPVTPTPTTESIAAEHAGLRAVPARRMSIG
jgi:hypothetical protein